MVLQSIHLVRGNKRTAMQIQLIEGDFNKADSLELVSQMIQVKIKYHEKAIQKNSSEEDIKYRESKIKLLQDELLLVREELSKSAGNLHIQANITIE
jgi:hypothetical protein